MTDPTRTRVARLIHVASAAAAAAVFASGLTPMPADRLVLGGIQTALVLALAKELEIELSEQELLALVAPLLAQTAGRATVLLLTRWVPGGIALNACVAFTLTEALGWAAYELLRRQREA